MAPLMLTRAILISLFWLSLNGLVAPVFSETQTEGMMNQIGGNLVSALESTKSPGFYWKNVIQNDYPETNRDTIPWVSMARRRYPQPSEQQITLPFRIKRLKSKDGFLVGIIDVVDREKVGARDIGIGPGFGVPSFSEAAKVGTSIRFSGK